MKIALCVRAVQTDGSSHFALQLGATLLGAGHMVSILAPYPRIVPPGVLTPGMCYVYINQRSWQSETEHIRHLGRLFCRERFDVVFIIAGLPIPNLEPALRLLPDTTALVPIVVGDRDHVYEPTLRTTPLWNLALAISPRLQQEMLRRIPQKPTLLLTTGIRQPTEQELDQRPRFPDQLRILYVGRLFGRKNVLMLPRIMAECGRRGVTAALTIVGSGPDREHLEAACRDAGVSHVVEFRSIPTQSLLYDALRNHQMLLFTSEYGEGLGLVLLEAQANGCVPVASRIPGVTDYAIDDGVTGLLAEVDDPESFARHLEFLSDEETWQRFSEAAIARTRRLFTLEGMARDYCSLLEKFRQGGYLLAGSRRAAPIPSVNMRSRIPRAALRIMDTVAELFTAVPRQRQQ